MNRTNHQNSLRETLMINLVRYSKPLYGLFFKSKAEPWELSVLALLQYPQQSLGRELGLFLVANRLKLMDKFEDHDVYHVLLQYSTSVVDEARMQFFLLGNGKRSLFALGTGFIASCFFPERWGAFYEAYKRGQHSGVVFKSDFLLGLNQPINDLRSYFQIEEHPAFSASSIPFA
ncbi:hypothetical protein KFE98_15855 [bacterium SCSIO 12741]|nr:hypothetical protein KFE98_15855 [bacterium SCSIO 12741]